jgi:hypothetical protein
MFGKINCLVIIRDHTATLRKQGTNKIRGSDIFLFYIFPAIISGIVVFFFSELSDALIPILITSLSIFAALLFNLLLLVHGAISRNVTSTRRFPDRTKYLREIFNNISFSILVSVLSIVLLIIYTQFITGCITTAIFTFFIYYLVLVFILALLMVLKRIHILLGEETKE